MLCGAFHHRCTSLKREAHLQGVFIVFQDKVKPGKNFTGTQLFDTGGAFYNVPGFLDNLKVSLKHNRTLLACGPTDADSRLHACKCALGEPQQRCMYAYHTLARAGSGTQLGTFRVYQLSPGYSVWASLYYFQLQFQAHKALCATLRLVLLMTCYASA